MLVDKTINQFIGELASDSPAPGGGSTAALAGALAGALTSMVCNLTVGNAKYVDIQEIVQSIRDRAAGVTPRLTACIDDDTQAFNAVMAAFKMPKASEEEKQLRTAAIQQATKGATLLPLQVAELCLEVLDMAGKILVIGNANAASDAAVAGLMAHAGLRGAICNVKINLPGIKDAAFVEDTNRRLAVIGEQAAKLQRDLEENVQKIIG